MNKTFRRILATGALTVSIATPVITMTSTSAHAFLGLSRGGGGLYRKR